MISHFNWPEKIRNSVFVINDFDHCFLFLSSRLKAVHPLNHINPGNLSAARFGRRVMVQTNTAKKKAYDPVSLQLCIDAIHPWLTGQARYEDGGYAFVCSQVKSKLWIRYYQKLIQQAGDFLILCFTDSFYEEIDRTCLFLPDFFSVIR